MVIKKGDMVRVTKLCLTPYLRGMVGKVVRKPRNNQFIVKFQGGVQLYTFGIKEVEGVEL